VFNALVVKHAESTVKWDSISERKYWMFPDAMQADFEPGDPGPINFICMMDGAI